MKNQVMRKSSHEENQVILHHLVDIPHFLSDEEYLVSEGQYQVSGEGLVHKYIYSHQKI